MNPASLRPWMAAALCAAALLLGGCSLRGSDSEDTPTPGATGTPAPATETATAGEPPTHTPTAAPSPTPAATSEPATSADAEAALAAALEALDARYVHPLTRDACVEGNDEGQICIDLVSDDAAVAAGIARFEAGDPNAGAFTFFMGRDANGAWHYWFGTQQQTYILQRVPGTLVACGVDGPAEIRAEPSADAELVATLEDEETLEADGFVLTAPGKFGAGGSRGEGWYHVSSPSEGWINARHASDAALGDCLLHDALEQVAHG